MSWIDKQAELAARAAELGTQSLPELECFLTPTAGRIIVQQDDHKQESSLIYVAKDKQTRPTTGIIIAVPSDNSLDQLLGEKILFAQFSGVALNFKGVHNWRVLQVEEILAIFNNKDDVYEMDTNVL